MRVTFVALMLLIAGCTSPDRQAKTLPFETWIYPPDDVIEEQVSLLETEKAFQDDVQFRACLNKMRPEWNAWGPKMKTYMTLEEWCASIMKDPSPVKHEIASPPGFHDSLLQQLQPRITVIQPQAETPHRDSSAEDDQADHDALMGVTLYGIFSQPGR